MEVAKTLIRDAYSRAHRAYMREEKDEIVEALIISFIDLEAIVKNGGQSCNLN